MDYRKDAVTNSQRNAEDFQNQTLQKIHQVPLPNEIPYAARDLNWQNESSSQSPGFSQTVSSLISQNDDLHNRLSVILKRNAELERRLSQYQEMHSQITNENDSLRDEFSLYERRFQKAELDVKKARERQIEAEGRYAEYYSNTQHRVEELNDENNELKKSLYRLRNFHRKVMSYGKLAFQELKLSLRLSRDEQAQSEIDRLKYLEMSNQLKDEVLVLQQSLQELEHKSESDRRKLVENYESRLQSITHLHEVSIQQLGHYKERIRNLEAEVNESIEIQVESQNRAIFEERKRIESENKLILEIEKIQSENTGNRARISEIELVNKDLVSRLEFEILKNGELIAENEELRDRRDGLQIIWEEHNKVIEEQRRKIDSFEKLNLELARQLKVKKEEVDKVASELQSTLKIAERERRQMALNQRED
ncbi:MAG: hypothetical protein KDD25_05150 [Bdellovibrionales bacterium]|nr:hypothetical protein [Bdellovibrionales bacterium]